MVRIVIASYGALCEGLKSSTKMTSGTIAQRTVVALQPGENPDVYDERLYKTVDQMDDGHGVLMLTDPRGGIPFSRSIMLIREKYIMLTVGANLLMLLSVALGKYEDSTLGGLAALTEKEAKKSIGATRSDRQ